MTTDTSKPLAPKPPATSFLPVQNIDASSIEPSAGHAAKRIDLPNLYEDGHSGLPEGENVAEDLGADEISTAVSERCRLKERFDRKVLLAYEWDRSRLSFDVDGINMAGADDAGVYMQYKLRLQPETVKKKSCRYKSKWQGMVGSGYNELFLRDKNTVWSEIKHMKQDVKDYIRDFQDMF